MTETKTINDEVLKDILAGKYRNSFLIYGRKSTDEPDNQKNSIKYQRAENTKFAQKQKLPVPPITLDGFCRNGIISERHSAFKEDGQVSITASGLVQYQIERPKFQRLIQFLSKGLFKGVIVLCWDRLSRNQGDDTVIRKLMKMGMEVHFVFAKYEETSSGALHMDIDSMFSGHYSRVVAEKVKLTTANLRDRGICTFKAPIGYLNQGTMEHKPFDPIRAPIVKRVFEILVTKEWSLSDLTKWASTQGLTTMPMRRRKTPEEKLAEEEEDEETKIVPLSRPVTANLLHRTLTNRFYTGRVPDSKGTWIPSKSHKALVSDELFAEAQKLLQRKRVSVRYVQKLDLPGRALVRCTDCKRVYTPYIQKGIQYFYARCRPGCPNPRKSISAEFITTEILKCLDHLSFTDDELARIDAGTKLDITVLEADRQRKLEQNARRKKKVNEDLAYLRDNKLSLLKTEVYSPESLREEENRLDAEYRQLEESERQPEVPAEEVVRKAKKLSELLKYGSEYYRFANLREKDTITSIIFSELFFSGKTLAYQCKNGFRVFEKRLSASGGPKEWLSEAIQSDNLLTNSISELESFLELHTRSP